MQEGPEGQANHYFWVFDIGETVPEITWPENIRLWENNQVPAITANSHYSISVYDGVAMYEVIVGGEPSPTPAVGVPTHIRSSKVWSELPWVGSGNEEYDSIGGAATAAGVTVEEFQQLLSGNVPMFSAQPENIGEEISVTHLEAMIMNEGVDGDDIHFLVRYDELWFDNIVDQQWYEFSYDKYGGTETWTVTRSGDGA